MLHGIGTLYLSLFCPFFKSRLSILCFLFSGLLSGFYAVHRTESAISWVIGDPPDGLFCSYCSRFFCCIWHHLLPCFLDTVFNTQTQSCFYSKDFHILATFRSNSITVLESGWKLWSLSTHFLTVNNVLFPVTPVSTKYLEPILSSPNPPSSSFVLVVFLPRTTASSLLSRLLNFHLFLLLCIPHGSSSHLPTLLADQNLYSRWDCMQGHS